jgi:hypothetical protein
VYNTLGENEAAGSWRSQRPLTINVEQPTMTADTNPTWNLHPDTAGRVVRLPNHRRV